MGANDGRIMLVTGAAGGIGIAISRQLAESGATVIAADMNQQLGQAAAESLARSGLRVEFRSLNVANEASWSETIDTISSRHGRLDAVVNAAGTVVVKIS